MIRLFKYRYFNLALHAAAWVILLIFPFLLPGLDGEHKIGDIPGLYFTYSGIVHMVIFYLNALFLYPKLLNRVYWPVYIVSVLLLISLSYWVKLEILTTYFPDALLNVRTHVLFPSVIIFIASMFYSITVDKIQTETLQKQNEAIQLAMELKFLRSQINPHFLFNVLTNLVALARKKSDKLEPSLLMMSCLMRYMLYGAGKPISLRQEIEYIESYIALQKLRFETDIRIVFDVELSADELNYNIEPMLLMPFVENAFKHGINHTEQHGIIINLSVSGGELIFKTKNKYSGQNDATKDESSGIGLSNVRSRLSLLYPAKHQLKIDTHRNMYMIDLTLNLL